MNRTAVALFVLVAVVAAASSWLSQRTRMEQPTTTADAVERPDYYLEGYVAINLDLSGAPEYRFSGARMTHYPESDRVELESPNAELYGEAGEAPWFMRAEHGRITDSGNRVNLTGSVRIWRIEPGMAMATEQLVLFPDRELAITDEPVTFSHPQGTVAAVGMKADLGAERVELLSDVRGVYAP